VCAVASGKVRGVDGFLSTIAVAQNAHNASGLLSEANHLHSPFNLGSCGLEISAENGLCVRLRDKENVGKPRIGSSNGSEINRNRGVAVHVKHESRCRPAAGRQRFSQAERLQDFETPGLDAQRTRFVSSIGLLVDDAKTDTEPCELTGQCQACRSGTHDEHVNIRSERRR
jgi:hypothetical protein